MEFDSLTAALEMGGHGGYVWFVYGVAVLVVAFLLLAPSRRSRQFMQEQRGQMRREARAAERGVSNASGT
jgi:heme exporter protein D